MDLDAFSAVRQERWARLDQLSKRRRLTGAEADELAHLYQSTATDLSQVRSAAPDPVVIARLSMLLGFARTSLAGARQPIWKEGADFLVHALPAALYRIRFWTIAVMTGFVAVAVVSGVYTANTDGALDALAPLEDRQHYAEEQFSSYYVENPSTSFFARVWTNNSWVAVQSVGGGFTGILTFKVQYENAVGTGQAAAIMHEFGYLDIFFQSILPHGFLELTAIFVAGAAGFKIFWTLVVPGHRPRLQALAEEGRSLFGVAAGLVIMLFVSGLLEGYLTGSALPWILKDVIGGLVLAVFWLYVWVPGGRAYRAGYTGDVSADHREDVLAVAG